MPQSRELGGRYGFPDLYKALVSNLCRFYILLEFKKQLLEDSMQKTWGLKAIFQWLCVCVLFFFCSRGTITELDDPARSKIPPPRKRFWTTPPPRLSIVHSPLEMLPGFQLEALSLRDTKTNKHKQLFGIVPGTGEGQICLCVALFMGKKGNTSVENPQN